jgi:hypothetical protein
MIQIRFDKISFSSRFASAAMSAFSFILNAWRYA